jgi:hypothetical protein
MKDATKDTHIVVDIVPLENNYFFGSFQYIILLQKAYHWLNDAIVMQSWSYKNDVCQLLLFISFFFFSKKNSMSDKEVSYFFGVSSLYLVFHIKQLD